MFGGCLLAINSITVRERLQREDFLNQGKSPLKVPRCLPILDGWNAPEPSGIQNDTMKPASSILLLSAGLAVNSGCNTTMPRVNQVPDSLKEEQAQLTALKHWQDLAEEMAEELAKRGDLFKDGQKVIVEPSEYDTAFSKAFQKFVLRAFQDRNIPVIHEPGEVEPGLVLSLNYNVQNIRHLGPKSNPVVNVVEGVGTGVNKVVTGDRSRPVEGDTEEVLVFTSLSDQSKDVFVFTQIAYIDILESHFYLEQKIEKPRSLGTTRIPVINEKKNI
jgi:hypothetical protein